MMPLSPQFGRLAARTGEATPKASVNAATVVVAMRTRIEFTFDSFVFHKEPGQRRAPSRAGSRREPLPASVRRSQGTLVHCDRSVVKGGDGRGPKAFDDQINAQRKFPDCDRDCEQRCRGGMLPDQTEDDRAVASDQQGRADKSEQRKPPWHQA